MSHLTLEPRPLMRAMSVSLTGCLALCAVAVRLKVITTKTLTAATAIDLGIFKT